MEKILCQLEYKIFGFQIVRELVKLISLSVRECAVMHPLYMPKKGTISGNINVEYPHTSCLLHLC